MADLAGEYQRGASLSQLSKVHGIPVSTIRFRLHKLGILRGNREGIKLAASQGRMARTGPRQPVSETGRKNMSAARIAWADRCAIGVSSKTNGYVEYTRGEHKGRSVHVVLIEQRLGRRLLPDEIVHHIDGDRHNNNLNNLALMTREAHARLHRFEDGLANKQRERDKNGRFI